MFSSQPSHFLHHTFNQHYLGKVEDGEGNAKHGGFGKGQEFYVWSLEAMPIGKDVQVYAYIRYNLDEDSVEIVYNNPCLVS